MFCELWCTESLRGCFGSESVDEELFSEVSGQACASLCRSRGSPQEAQSDPESHCEATAREDVFLPSRVYGKGVSRTRYCGRGLV